MKTKILGLGTANPDHCMSQEDGLKMFQDIVCETDRQRRLARALFRKSGVDNRHFVVPGKTAYTWAKPAAVAVTGGEEICMTLPPSELPELTPGESPGPTSGERMKLYAEFASDLAFQSAKAAVSESGLQGGQITHLVVVTCTGFNSPGVDIDLIERLGLPPTTQRINVGFMGCHGAINGLRASLAITQSDPAANVLLCCVEVCSFHYRFQWNPEGIIGNALFADGSASLVLSQSNSKPNAPKPTDIASRPDSEVELGSGWQLIDTGSVVIPNSQREMSWKIGDHGFEMKLTSNVGDAIESSLRDWLVDWLAGHDLAMSDIDFWGVHPGGPRILSAVETALGLSEDHLQTSRSILRQYGNMSSPTVLFVLNEFMTQQAESPRRDDGSHGNCVLVAFGPGLVAEIALIKSS